MRRAGRLPISASPDSSPASAPLPRPPALNRERRLPRAFRRRRTAGRAGGQPPSEAAPYPQPHKRRCREAFPFDVACRGTASLDTVQFFPSEPKRAEEAAKPECSKASIMAGWFRDSFEAIPFLDFLAFCEKSAIYLLDLSALHMIVSPYSTIKLPYMDKTGLAMYDFRLRISIIQLLQYTCFKEIRILVGHNDKVMFTSESPISA